MSSLDLNKYRDVQLKGLQFDFASMAVTMERFWIISAASKFAKICLLSTATAVLFACTFRPIILSARSYSSADNEVIEIRLRSDDARTLKNRQIYFSLVVIDCGGGKVRFPMEPYIAGQRATEFKFPMTETDVVVTGSMPVKNYALFHGPCALIEGSGYSLSRTASPQVPVVESRAY
jgi:hypothetical protein